MNIKKGNQLFKSGNYKAALEIYQQIASDYPVLRKSLEANIRLSRSRLGNAIDSFESRQIDILAVIWLSNIEPLHDIIMKTIERLNYNCITTKVFAPKPMTESLFHNARYIASEASSLRLSNALIPKGFNLPESFIEKRSELLAYLFAREKHWLNKSKDSNLDELKSKIVRGIRYWTRIVDTHNPKLMLIWGSSSPVSALLIELCKHRSIKYQIIERGLLQGTVIVDDNAQFGYSYSNNLLSATPATNHNSLSCIDKLNNYVMKTSAVAYRDFNNVYPEDIFKSGRPIILFIGSNDLGSSVALTDTQSLPLNLSEYKSSWEVASDLAKSINLVCANALLYIKPHPADKVDYQSLESSDVKILSSVNIDYLIEHATICCTLCSTAIAMCLLKKKPLVTFTSTDVSNVNVAYEVYRKSELVSQLRNAFFGIGLEQKIENANTYFEFAINYRLYFQDHFREYGYSSHQLCERLSKIVFSQYRKYEQLQTNKLIGVKPVLFTVHKSDLGYCAPVDVVIPIYDDYKLTKSCIEYTVNVLSSHPDANLILINDCSPNTRLRKYLHDLDSCASRNIKIHTNETNIGFSGAVNMGISLSRANADVLLLNSDALISCFTINALQLTAYSNPKIATVSPISTDGGLLSMPAGQHSLDILSQNDLNFINEELGKSFKRLGLLLPVNHGACLYIKKSAINAVGFLNELVFGRGYSEEIDLCLRMRKNGFINVGCCFSFIQHIGGVSFGDSSHPLKKKNREIIARKYTEYFAEVRQFSQDWASCEEYSRLDSALKRLISECSRKPTI